MDKIFTFYDWTTSENINLSLLPPLESRKTGKTYLEESTELLWKCWQKAQEVERGILIDVELDPKICPTCKGEKGQRDAFDEWYPCWTCDGTGLRKESLG